MNFGEALQALKDGFKIRRSVWEGYWYLAENVHAQHMTVVSNDGSSGCHGFTMQYMIVACIKDGQGCAPAMPYQEDILSEDWYIVD